MSEISKNQTSPQTIETRGGVSKLVDRIESVTEKVTSFKSNAKTQLQNKEVTIPINPTFDNILSGIDSIKTSTDIVLKDYLGPIFQSTILETIEEENPYNLDFFGYPIMAEYKNDRVFIFGGDNKGISQGNLFKNYCYYNFNTKTYTILGEINLQISFFSASPYMRKNCTLTLDDNIYMIPNSPGLIVYNILTDTFRIILQSSSNVTDFIDQHNYLNKISYYNNCIYSYYNNTNDYRTFCVKYFNLLTETKSEFNIGLYSYNNYSMVTYSNCFEFIAFKKNELRFMLSNCYIKINLDNNLMSVINSSNISQQFIPSTNLTSFIANAFDTVLFIENNSLNNISLNSEILETEIEIRSIGILDGKSNALENSSNVNDKNYHSLKYSLLNFGWCIFKGQLLIIGGSKSSTYKNVKGIKMLKLPRNVLPITKGCIFNLDCSVLDDDGNIYDANTDNIAISNGYYYSRTKEKVNGILKYYL